jgi:predicted enzyme related to lactoylglutathione lyase
MPDELGGVRESHLVKGRSAEPGGSVETSTSVVTGVDFVSIPTRDLAAAMDFYEHVLGLRRSALWQPPGQEPMGAEYENGTVTFALMESERFGIQFQAHKVPIAMRVDDVAEARAALEARGVTFLGETIDSGVCHQALFEDPDGNVLDLHHRYAPRAPAA